MFFGDDVGAVKSTNRFGRARLLGLFLTGAAAAGLLGGCTSTSVNDALTVQPATSSAATTAGQSNDAAQAQSSGTTLPGVDQSATQQQSGTAGRRTAASRRSRSGRGRKSAAARRTETPSPSSPAATSGTATQNAPFVEQGVAKTGTYPKFVPPKSATSQMTDAEKKKFEDAMAARIKANQKPAETPAEAAAREKLLKALTSKGQVQGN